MNRPILYTLPSCPKCAVLKQLLDKNKIDYKLFDDIRAMIAIGITTVPMLSIDGELMSYNDAIKLVNTSTHKTERSLNNANSRKN